MNLIKNSEEEFNYQKMKRNTFNINYKNKKFCNKSVSTLNEENVFQKTAVILNRKKFSCNSMSISGSNLNEDGKKSLAFSSVNFFRKKKSIEDNNIVINDPHKKILKINTNFFAHMKKPTKKIESMKINNKSCQVSLKFDKNPELDEFLSKHNIKEAFQVMLQKHKSQKKINLKKNIFKVNIISSKKNPIFQHTAKHKINNKLDISNLDAQNNVKDIVNDFSFSLNLSKIEKNYK